ncbi:MAG TPA: M1 family metallopeptidase [Bacteroidales bacterium]|nr:M1 family metallopeptidase [Bacteroidales bacterium]
MKRVSVLLLILTLFLTVKGQVIFDRPLSPRVTGYDIRGSLNTSGHTVSGEMMAWWVNTSSVAVPDAMLHMYLNAFSSTKTSFAGSGHWSAAGDEGWGWIKIRSITDSNGSDLSSLMKFISPDDGNIYDKTVLQIMLLQPVAPGDTLRLNISFESKLPSPIVRTGFAGDFYFVAQWFPKFGVYETAGMRQRESDGWNCHQFHPNSEFYANHSVYNVSMTMPSDYVAGSGGVMIEETDNGDSTKKVVWRAEDIVDFAWTAWPGYKVVTDKWRGVDIILLTTKNGLKISDKQIEAVKFGLEYLDANVGSYPWPHLTFVDPPVTGAGAGGMEYTTLFTSSGAGMVPGFLKMPEMVTIHEFGHAYFMGILASNEFEEPWLDEGVNSYWEQRIVDHYYGDGYGMVRLPFLKASDTDLGRSSYITSPSRSVATNDLPSWMYPHGTYGMMSYQKTAVWLHTLEGIIGTETMNNVFREYYRRWSFRHPSGRDFIAVVNEVVRREHGNRLGDDMNWYFDQVLYGSGTCDYKVLNVSNSRITGYSGIIEGDTVTFARSDRKADTLYKASIRIERSGEVMLPVEVLVGFDDGDEVMEYWDGKAKYRDFEYEGTRKVSWAKIDPENKIDMDVNRINNSWGRDDDFPASRRMMTKYVTLIQLLISMITI